MSDQPVRLMRGGLTGRIYAVVRYKELGDGVVESLEKYDVTEDFEDILRGLQAEAKGAPVPVELVIDIEERADMGLRRI